VDSAESTAQEVARRLQIELQIGHSPASRKSALNGARELKFFATDSAEKFRKLGARFLRLPVEDVLHVDLKE
jgi:hypothetical protein